MTMTNSLKKVTSLTFTFFALGCNSGGVIDTSTLVIGEHVGTVSWMAMGTPKYSNTPDLIRGKITFIFTDTGTYSYSSESYIPYPNGFGTFSILGDSIFLNAHPEGGPIGFPPDDLAGPFHLQRRFDSLVLEKNNPSKFTAYIYINLATFENQRAP
jgi:hypothetical protein